MLLHKKFYTNICTTIVLCVFNIYAFLEAQYIHILLLTYCSMKTLLTQKKNTWEDAIQKYTCKRISTYQKRTRKYKCIQYQLYLFVKQVLYAFGRCICIFLSIFVWQSPICFICLFLLSFNSVYTSIKALLHTL